MNKNPKFNGGSGTLMTGAKVAKPKPVKDVGGDLRTGKKK